MPEPIIKVANLSKNFVISHEGRERYHSLRDVIANKAKDLFSFSRKEKLNTNQELFWALRDVNFEINPGDRVGIIGRNGAGKSTLLKILSRITEPTKGRIEINGRVASLLEVGTGFHPELTGRENIFLNGAILGMSRAEIKSKFDEIVAFAEVEQFLDTPVKRYSSGMYVRLAFAVAAHLEPEILIVDEVLAVGDAQFQKKCLGKMKDVSGQGRTVIFVSHNMLAIKSLCSRGIWLHQGALQKTGSIDDVVNSYLKDSSSVCSSQISIEKEQSGFIVHSLEVSNNGINGNFDIEEELVIDIKVSSNKDFETININLFFNTIDGTTIFVTCSAVEECKPGVYNFRCQIPASTFNDEVYNIELMVVENGPNVLLHLKDVVSIEGVEGKRDGPWLEKFPGLLRPMYFKWSKRVMHEF